ncbi:hypothetical protein K458DRAFT_407749 [Lentithecium fluviatile CBS 122367]|uniref:Uncharacterized protein n=1 Tax=Lentithecium fluviatile CBS 122367 TaxID=1168545 RepID=A0A6G1INT6_9PLEO|nr:hypothetical protein K458DRAFT_407749 [Lentithecium fluviatile CBS 122367]
MGYPVIKGTTMEDYDDNGPMCTAVLRRDLPALIHAMNQTRIFDYEVFLLSIPWVEGLRLMLSVGSDLPFKSQIALLKTAILWKELEAVRAFLEAGFMVTQSVWNNTCYHLEKIGEDESGELFSAMIHNVNAARNLRDMSLAEQDARVGHVCGEFFPYESWRLCKIAAQCAWDGGYCDIDSPSFENPDHGTPIWKRALEAYRSETNESYDLGLDILKWLYEHGARLNWTHPKYLTTPAHLIGRGIASSIWSENQSTHEPDLEAFLRSVLLSEFPDSCTCTCSEAGCHILTCAVTTSMEWGRFPRSNRLFQQHLVEQMVELVDSERHDYPWLVPAMLRCLTFEELGLTHTCCVHMPWSLYELSSYSPPTSEDIKSIRYSESKDIALLETLLDGFTKSWGTYSGTLRQFIDDIWTSTINKELTKAKEAKEESLHALGELGVVLEEQAGHEEQLDPDSDDEGRILNSRSVIELLAFRA